MWGGQTIASANRQAISMRDASRLHNKRGSTIGPLDLSPAQCWQRQIVGYLGAVMTGPTYLIVHTLLFLTLIVRHATTIGSPVWRQSIVCALSHLTVASAVSDFWGTGGIGDISDAVVQYFVLSDIVYSGFRSDCRGSRFDSIFGVFSGLKRLLGS